MTSSRFGARVGVTAETVREWVEAGKLEPAGTTAGGHLRFTEEQAVDWLAGTLEAHVLAQRASLRAMTKPAKPAGLTVLQAMDARIADLAADTSKSPESVAAFQVSRKALGPFLDVSTVDAILLRNVRVELRALGHGNETVNTHLRRAAASWRWCEKLGRVTGPWPKVEALKRPPRKKRPYTPTEAAAVFAWIGAWEGGRWLPILLLIDDTGRRVSEVCRLQAKDVDEAEKTVRVRLKGKAPLVLPVSDEAMGALRPILAERDAEDFLFRIKARSLQDDGSGWKPQDRSGVLQVVRRAIEALGIPDGERLDVHSLRRSYAADATRAGLPNDVTRRLTGHETAVMLEHYQKDAVGDDLRAAQGQVAGYRQAQRDRAKKKINPESETPPAEGPGSASQHSVSDWGYQDSNLRPRPYQFEPREPQVATLPDPAQNARSGETRGIAGERQGEPPVFREVHHRALADGCVFAASAWRSFVALGPGGALWWEVVEAMGRVGPIEARDEARQILGRRAAPARAQEQA